VIRILKKIVGLVLSGAAIIGIIILAKFIGWSPLNMIFGPTYRAEQTRQLPSDLPRRYEKYKRNHISIKYPQLLQYLRSKGKLSFAYESASREPITIQVVLGSSGEIIVMTLAFLGTSPKEAKSTPHPTEVAMVDQNEDGELDILILTKPDGQVDHFEAPFNKAFLMLWDMNLSLIFRYLENPP